MRNATSIEKMSECHSHSLCDQTETQKTPNGGYIKYGRKFKKRIINNYLHEIDCIERYVKKFSKTYQLIRKVYQCIYKFCLYIFFEKKNHGCKRIWRKTRRLIFL